MTTMSQPIYVPVDSDIGNYGTSSITEDWIADLLLPVIPDASTTLDLMLSGVFLASSTSLAYEFRLRHGGTPQGPDGQELMLLAGQGVTQAQIDAGGDGIGQAWMVADLLPIAQPVTVKLTGRVFQAGQQIQIRGGMLRVLHSEIKVKRMGTSQPYGTDIWFDVLAADGEANTMVTTGGDWQLVTGPTAVVQSLTRRYLTSPGEWKTLPNYGAGLRAACRKRGGQADLATLTAAIKQQSMLDDRVQSVGDVGLTWLGPNALQFTITVVLKSDSQALTFGGVVTP